MNNFLQFQQFHRHEAVIIFIGPVKGRFEEQRVGSICLEVDYFGQSFPGEGPTCETQVAKQKWAQICKQLGVYFFCTANDMRLKKYSNLFEVFFFFELGYNSRDSKGSQCI
jgi:hypothetical protein